MLFNFSIVGGGIITFVLIVLVYMNQILNMSQFLLYIDPGSGSLLFQALLSGLLTVLVFFKRIVAYFKYKFGKKKTEEIDNLD
jgi:hypothetical protein